MPLVFASQQVTPLHPYTHLHMYMCNQAHLVIAFYLTFLPQFFSSNLLFYQQKTMAEVAPEGSSGKVPE